MPHTNLLKDLREEKERNKDGVDMFLHKWGDTHSLGRNPKLVQLLDASLLLIRNAYKWWMSLKEHPLSWAEFEKRNFYP